MATRTGVRPSRNCRSTESRSPCDLSPWMALEKTLEYWTQKNPYAAGQRSRRMQKVSSSARRFVSVKMIVLHSRSPIISRISRSNLSCWKKRSFESNNLFITHLIVLIADIDNLKDFRVCSQFGWANCSMDIVIAKEILCQSANLLWPGGTNNYVMKVILRLMTS